MDTTRTKLVNRPTVTTKPAAARRVQTASLRVSTPTDPAEKEAEATARRIVRMQAPASSTVARLAPLVPNTASSGAPLPPGVRRFMERRFGANFGGVRMHDGPRAAQLNQRLGARAFAVGHQVFFGAGQFRPETHEGRELIAHELTHTIQQGAVAQSRDTQLSRSAIVERAPVQVHRSIIGDVLDYFAEKAYNIPGYRMFTLVIGINPINMSRAERTPANILRAVIEFMPGGNLITRALDQYGIIDRVAPWVAEQIESLGITGGMIRDAIMEFIDSLSWTDVFDLGDVWDRAVRIFTRPIDRIKAFVSSLVNGIIRFIKEAILKPIAGLLEGRRGYNLLKALLGRDPVTGEPYPTTMETIIAGFMNLIGQDEVWQRIQEARAIPRAVAWFRTAVAEMVGFVLEIPRVFLAALTSLTLTDILTPWNALSKIGHVFGSFAARFFSWALGTVLKLLEIVFDVVSPGAWGYVKRTGAALANILRNPIPFVRNLVRAAIQGFDTFARRFGVHLRTGLVEWLTGSLPGVYVPREFSLGELVRFVFSLLGLSWQNVRAKLVVVAGEPVVRAMETGFYIVVTLVTQGPAAAWERMKAELATLRDAVIGGIIDLVTDAIVKQGIPKLVAMFIPGAGFISAILSIYETVMVFVRRISTIVQVVRGFVDSIIAIAGGAIGTAVARVESALASALSMAIALLAGFAGLGRVTDKIMNVVRRVRATVDRGIDALIAWVMSQGRKLFARKMAAATIGDAKVEKGFSLPNEQHTVTARIRDGRLEVRIASERESEIMIMIADAKAEVAADQTRTPEQNRDLLRLLDGARDDVRSMEQDWNATPKQKEEFQPWAEQRLTQIVTLMGMMGADGIKAFRDFKGKPLAKRYLPANYDVRQALYIRGSGWAGTRAGIVRAGAQAVRDDVDLIVMHRATNPPLADAAWQRLDAALRIPTGATKFTISHALVAATQYDVDHTDTLSAHWAAGGNNGADRPRWDLSAPGKLRYITQSQNLARPKGNYWLWVGKDFTSQYADGGMQNAKRIDGQPFLDAPGGNPI